MNVAIIVATAVLLIQGTRIVMRVGAPPFVRAFGVLTLLLAGLSLVLFGILFWGEAVLSPEFDVVMARGHPRGLIILVIGFAVAAGLGLHVQRLKALLPGRLGGLLLLGLAVGAAAAMRITSLNAELSREDTARAFWIYSYDLWWPPLLIWISACFLDGAITVLGVHDRRIRTGAFLAALFLLSLRARARGIFTDPTSAWLWSWATVAAVAGGVLLAIWLAWSARLRPEDALPRLRGWWPAFLRGWKRIVTAGWSGLRARAWAWLRSMAGQLLAVLALATIAASLADIFYVGWLPQAGALVILATAWTCLAEVTAKGPLRAFVVDVVPRAYERLANQESWIRHGWLVLGERLAHPLSWIGGVLRRLVSLRPFPEAIAKIVVLFVALVIAYEIPHAGKTLLQPFTALTVKMNRDEVPTVSPQTEIGRAVFDHLINTLGTLTLELQPDVILLLPPEAERGARFRTLAPGGAGSIDLFLTQDTSVEVAGGVKVPLGLVLRPVLQPIRWLLRVRVVDGSVLADPQGYTVLVRSGSGEVWRTRLANDEVSGDFAAGDSASARSIPDNAFSRLSLELAFRIMSTEPALAKFGMTRSWEAFRHFKRGLDSWQEFSLHRGQGDPDSLSSAIQHFRIAIGVDPEFALAHYRLGVALHNDGQPLAAAEALRASLKANPGFVPAMVALASVLYGAEQDLGPQPIWLPMMPQRPTGSAKLQEARHLWQSVIKVESGASSLDRAAAWAGLCRYALDEPEHRRPAQEQSDPQDGVDPKDSLSYRIAYFYCQQSERLYAALFATPRQDLRVKTARAAELASIGVLLERHGPRRKPRSTSEWQCSTHNAPASYYTRAALTYYRQALTLLPDDTVLRCHEASAAAREPGLMQALKSEAASRWNLAEGYRDEARRHLKAALRPDETAPTPDRLDPARRRHRELAAANFGRALNEYEATLERDPTNFDALNRYAQVFWDWRRGEADKILETGPGLEHARRAEANARRAVAMIEGKQIRMAGFDGAAPSPPAQVTRVDSPSASWAGRATGGAPGESVPRHLGPAAATAQASLGAVLVAQARPHEAIEVLEIARQHAPEHASFDYVRWLLAQAHLCAARKEFQEIRGTESRDDPRRLGSIAAHRDEARAALDIIRAHERTRESQPIAGLTDIGKSDEICRREGQWATTRIERERMYSLNQMEATNYRSLCLWLGVRIEPPEGWADEKPLYLHVWGGQVDSRMLVEIREQGRRSDPIALMPPRSRFYMAQLEDAQHQPLSPAVFLKQPGEEDGPMPSPAPKGATPNAATHAPAIEAGAPGAGPAARCPQDRNLIRLSFDRSGSSSTRAAAAE